MEGVTQPFVPPPPRDDLLWVGIDLDGTLAHSQWSIDNPNAPIGEPITANLDKAMELIVQGYKVWIHTSRPWSDYEQIEAWCEHHDIPVKGIICGKPLFKYYIDDRNIDPLASDWSDPLSFSADSWNAGYKFAMDQVKGILDEHQ